MDGLMNPSSDVTADYFIALKKLQFMQLCSYIHNLGHSPSIPTSMTQQDWKTAQETLLSIARKPNMRKQTPRILTSSHFQESI